MLELDLRAMSFASWLNVLNVLNVLLKMTMVLRAEDEGID